MKTIGWLFNKKTALVVFLLLRISTVSAQIPDGYYSTASEKTGEELKAALYNIIKGHTEYPYTSSSSIDVWDILKETDRDTANPDNLILIYSGLSVNAAQEYNSGNGWTREHVWAKSHGEFGTDPGAGTDAHHLRPENNYVNTVRNNRWFAESDEPVYYNNQFTGCYKGSDEWTWEPRDEVKGDVARMIFYMATRYEGENGEPDLEMVDYIPADNNTAEPIHAKLSDLLAWNLLDTVDSFERNRNEVVFGYQHNRNPFIDHPEYATYIWDETYEEDFSPVISGITQTPENPTSEDEVEITAVVVDLNNDLSNITLMWGLQSNSLSNTIAMDLVADTIFAATIPSLENNTVVYYQVFVQDSALNQIQSEVYSYTVVEFNQSPVISNLSYLPQNPNSSNTITIYADVSDSDGNLSEVLLNWGLQSNRMDHTVLMDYGNGNQHSASIPPQDGNSTIFYQIVAIDQASDTSWSDVQYFNVEIYNEVIYSTLSEVIVYPNPFNDAVNIILNQQITCNVSIYNQLGTQVYMSDINGNSTIYLNHLSSGVYYLRLWRNGETQVLKLVKL